MAVLVAMVVVPPPGTQDVNSSTLFSKASL